MKDGDGGGQDGKGKLYNYILISKHKRSNKKNGSSWSTVVMTGPPKRKTPWP